MLKKILIFIPILYLLALLQTSFFAHFNIWGFTPNLILILVIVVSFFEKSKGYLGFLTAFIGGFFLDIFSTGLFGMNVLILLILSFFIKIILKKYVQIPAH